MQHLEVLANMYKASVERKPERKISNLDELFGKDYAEQVRHLDLSKRGPVVPPLLWGDYLHHETQRFKDALERVVGRYAVPLGPDTVEIVEQLIASPCISRLEQVPAIRAAKPPQFRGWPDPLLYGMVDILRQYTDAFSALVETYNEVAPEAQQLVIREKRLWSNKASPQIGSARIHFRSADSDESDGASVGTAD
jgi:hypothetical protein